MYLIIEQILSAVILMMANIQGIAMEKQHFQETVQPPPEPVEVHVDLPNTATPETTEEEAIEKSSESTACPYDPTSMTWMEYSNACMTRLGYCPRDAQTREYIEDGVCIIPDTVWVKAL